MTDNKAVIVILILISTEMEKVAILQHEAMLLRNSNTQLFMSDTKIFSFPDGGSRGSDNAALIASLCQQRGLDPNMVAAMMNNRNGNGGWGDGSAWWIIILLIFGWGGFGGFGGGFGGRGNAQGLADLGNLVNNDAGRELLMSAIQGNGQAISQLASTVHCDVNALQTAISGVSQGICQLGNTIGLGQRDIIAAINSGNCQLATQLSNCCCGIQDAITRGNYENQISNLNQTNQLTSSINFVNSSVERGFAATNYAFADQTCQLKNEIAGLKQYVGDQFCNLEKREMQREIAQLRDERTQFQTSALLQQQSQNLINTLRPCPVPAYITCNPFGCQGGLNDGYNYGYGYNGGCGSCNG